MVWVPDWLMPRARRLSGAQAPEDIEPGQRRSDGFGSASNTSRSVIEIVRPHLASGQCLIVTGYQDFLSSLSIILREVPDISVRSGAKIRVAFGIDTQNALSLVGRGKPVAEAAKLYFLAQRGLAVDDASDLAAILAADAIRGGSIDLRVFDPAKARDVLGVGDDRRLHAKLVVSSQGAISGSANFSRAGLYHNIEFMDGFEEAADEGAAQRAYKDRQAFAELVWQASTDWNSEALEILDGLLRPVSAEDAAARLIQEQTSFKPWRMDLQPHVAGRKPFEHQVGLVYETSQIVYEHGFAFLESPTGSGKTDIGKHLGWTLARTFEAAVGDDHTGDIPRGGAMVIAPPRVIGSWTRNAPRTVTVVPNTQVAARKSSCEDEDVEQAHRMDQYGVLIIDESHTVTPGFEESSKRAEAIEFAPPSWNVCLSATLLGNKDVDWLAHMQEKRASIFMSPSYLAQMKDLFEREASLSDMMEGETTADALSSSAREALSNMLSPFLAHRQRLCVGESVDRQDKSRASYPPFRLHRRPSRLSLSKLQGQAVDEIVRLTGELAPGRRLTSVTTSRFGTKSEKRHNQNSLYARNLLNVLRANSAQALWEMEKGAIGQALRRFEEEDRRKNGLLDRRQGDLFGNVEEPGVSDGVTPRCDRLRDLLAHREIQKLDTRRYEEALNIQQRHKRVVFLAERVDTLQIFAEQLSRMGGGSDAHQNFVASSERAAGGPSQTELKRAVADICGDEDLKFHRIKAGHAIEDYFRPGGKHAPDGPASMFLTYQMAEGINLQSADALVLLGVTSNLKELIQGLGRIDRIDSEHEMIHYHLLDIAVGHIASDEKVAQRLANYRALSGRERLEKIDDADGDTQEILQSVAAYLREPKRLRQNNFHDMLAQTRGRINATRYAQIEGLEITGLWGAELALLDGAESFTLLHLRGDEGRERAGSSFAPPRLLMIDQYGEVERNQIACAQALDQAYEETRGQGLAKSVPAPQRLAQAVEALSARIADLREWDLRPERTVSLLQSLSFFLAGPGTDGDGIGNSDVASQMAPDEVMFGDLSLRGIEYLCETWARYLDPYWGEAKRAVRERFAASEAQDYISIAEIMRHLDADLLKRGEIKASMESALESARAMGISAPGDVAHRVSVAFVSPGHAMH